jgi:uncharacterized protein YfaS (alpha-2-macroglobulin family)
LNVDKNTLPGAGGLDIQLASTLIPEIKAPAKQVIEDDDLPFAEPAASQLIIAANLKTLSEKYGQIPEFDFTKESTQAIAQLQKLHLADDRIIAYADHLDPGVYSLHYLVRGVTPGTFIYPGAKVYLQYAPEEFGRSADSTLVLEEKN